MEKPEQVHPSGAPQGNAQKALQKRGWVGESQTGFPARGRAGIKQQGIVEKT